ncbi:flippase [Candidatus Woesearchaeota archaeon]|nr:flippase [Candidatus Woesearchaeota archaeon]
MANEILTKVAKGSSLVFASIIFSKLFTYIFRVFVGRHYGTEVYGLWALGFSMFLVFNIIAGFGLQEGVLRYVSFFRGKEEWEKVKGVITSSLKIGLIAGSVIAVLLVLFREFISVSIYREAGLVPVLVIFAVLVPVGVLFNIILYTFLAFQRPGYNAFANNILRSVLLVLSVVLLYYAGFGGLGPTLSYAIALSVSFLAGFWLMETKVFKLVKSRIKSIRITKELLYFSVPLMLSSLIWMIISSTDTLMLGYFKNINDVGIYNGAVPTVQLLIMVPTALMSLIWPMITEKYAKGELDKYKQMYKAFVNWTLYANYLIFLFLFIFAGAVLGVLFGSEFNIGKDALMILLIGYFVYSIFYYSSYSVLTMMKKSKQILIMNSFIVLLNIGLNWLLIPKYGMEGAAIATTIALIVSSVGYITLTYLMSKVNVFGIRQLMVLALGGFSGWIVLKVVEYLGLGYKYYMIALYGLSLFVVYSIFLLISMRKEDIVIIKAIFKKLKR